MKEKVKAEKFLLFLCLAVLCTFAICAQALATQLVPMQVGEWFQMHKYDVNTPSNGWNVRMEILGTATLNGKQYFHVRQINYTGSDDVGDMYWRSTDTQLLMYSSSGEYPVLETGPVGTTWTYTEDGGETIKETIVDIGPLTVPYGSYATAYEMEHHAVDQHGGSISASCYDWVVPGVGYVRERDEWGENTNSVLSTVGINPLCEDATYTSDGWEGLSWFGTFNITYSPWIYHKQLGWLYPDGTDTSGIWFWDLNMNTFLWTNQTIFPWLYSIAGKTWLYYVKGTSGPCWFYNYNAGKYEAY